MPDGSTRPSPTGQGVLRAWDYHTAWCNSLALERAGITAETPDPEDGIIARRPDGSPLGTLIEAGATNRVLDLIPPTTVETAVEELRRATAYAASCGITWVPDAWVDVGDIEAWVSAAHQGVLAVEADLAIRIRHVGRSSASSCPPCARGSTRHPGLPAGR